MNSAGNLSVLMDVATALVAGGGLLAMLHYFSRAFIAGNPADFARGAVWLGASVAFFMVSWLLETGKTVAGLVSLGLFSVIALGTWLVRRYAIHVDEALVAEDESRATPDTDEHGQAAHSPALPPPPPSSSGCALLLVRFAAVGALLAGITAAVALYLNGRTVAGLITAFLVVVLFAVGLGVRTLVAPALQADEQDEARRAWKRRRKGQKGHPPPPGAPRPTTQVMPFVYLAGFLALAMGVSFTGYLLFSGRWVAGIGAAVMVLVLVGAALLVRRVVAPTLEAERYREEMRPQADGAAADAEETPEPKAGPSQKSEPQSASPGPAEAGRDSSPRRGPYPTSFGSAASSFSASAPAFEDNEGPGAQHRRAATSAAPPPPTPQRSRNSRVDTRFLSMTLDHASGAMSGSVIAGPDKGRQLEQMPLPDLLALLRRCRQGDPPSAALLEAWLDRTQTVDWRTQAAAAERPADLPSMSVTEALAVLDLPPDATPEAVREAYRRLITRLHPDAGGSKWLAAKVNEARDALLRFPGNNRGA